MFSASAYLQRLGINYIRLCLGSLQKKGQSSLHDCLIAWRWLSLCWCCFIFLLYVAKMYYVNNSYWQRDFPSLSQLIQCVFLWTQINHLRLPVPWHVQGAVNDTVFDYGMCNIIYMSKADIITSLSLCSTVKSADHVPRSMLLDSA